MTTRGDPSFKKLRLFRRFTPPDFSYFENEITTNRLRLEAAQSLGDNETVLRLYISLGFCLFVIGREAEAAPLLDRATTLARHLGDHKAEIEALLYLATARQYLDERNLALSQFTASLARAAATGIHEFDHYIWHHRGRCEAELGEYTAAQHSFENALTLRLALGDPDRIGATRAALKELAEWSAQTLLLPIHDADFDWLSGTAPGTRNLQIPPGGAEDPQTLPIIRRMVLRLNHANVSGAWMIVANGEVVGLCNYFRPLVDGVVEFGYGVAASRRNRGHATAAIAAMLDAARSDPAITLVYAETATTNPASARALIKNNFVETSRREDPEDGTLIRWEKRLNG